ncbi:TAXI family TRAP transporter solute-binding subunit [Microvirga pudoricolor]|uniref:TAXI family TRAP transporter solute-binding subunit n=1 Tax=Microvirga pudoricolor TaxID=2778729 RepID=UPI0019504B85|nr:TAXI family TRAP transporter solute-binding subunit [Microvirga pudoricolor]MBM6592490.1 TAXI family TRAP transporter solute-binding subunit [Microvirga pudoricolor]
MRYTTRRPFPLIRRVLGQTLRLWLTLISLATLSVPVAAQTRPESGAASARAAAGAMNAGTLGVISGGADGTYIRIAADLATVLDGSDLRVLPIIGRGSLQNLRDIMFLRGVDIGIVQMDAREGLRNEGLEQQALNRLRYITRLYNEEVHVLASKDITDIRQLDGKKVNIDKAGSGTNLTARLIFEKLGIKPDLVTYDQASSYERLRSGEIAAALYVAGRPVRAISEFQGDGRFHLLAIPFEGEIAESYFPAKFTGSDYPRLVEPGQEINTLAVGSILAVFNWPDNSDRYRRVERFVNAFFSRFDEFTLPGRHPKWKEVSLTAEVPGWERSKAAQDWLESGRSGAATGRSNDFKAFMDAQGIIASAADRERLFREFIAWQRDRERTRTGAAR